MAYLVRVVKVVKVGELLKVVVEGLKSVEVDEMVVVVWLIVY